MDKESCEPGVEPGRIAEARQLTPGDHERLLHRILGQADIAEDSLADRKEPVCTRANQDAEGLPVAAPSLLDEIAIHRCPRSGAGGAPFRAY
jgi:hypothetical protein